MNINEIRWIWQQPTWPHFTWQEKAIQPLLQQLHFKIGGLAGLVTGMSNMVASPETVLDMLTQNILTSSAIEGEHPNTQSVRSSLAKRLGVVIKHPAPISARSEGLAQIALDAMQNVDAPLTLERLFQWHRWLFPVEEKKSTLTDLRVGALRGEEAMQIVSGRVDKPTVHYEAPPRDILDRELNIFIDWFNHSRNDKNLDPLLRAAICHLWFEIVHPFEDGNGRIGRALIDLALAQVDKRVSCLYPMSPVILTARKQYYHMLGQSKEMDITPWIVWFLQTLENAVQTSINKIERIMIKIRFWQHHQELDLLPEQRKVLNRLLDGGEKGFEHGISASQYGTITKVSKATATRHLTDLLAKKCIEKLPGEGRNTRYQVKI